MNYSRCYRCLLRINSFDPSGLCVICLKESSEEIKPRPSLLPPLALTEVSHVLTFGDDKHPDEKWKKMDPEDHVDAALRHIFAHMSGDKTDSESGRLHLAHAAARLLFAVELAKMK